MDTALRLQETRARKLVRTSTSPGETEEITERLIKINRRIKRLSRKRHMKATVAALHSMSNRSRIHQRTRKKLIRILKRRIPNNHGDLWTRVLRRSETSWGRE